MVRMKPCFKASEIEKEIFNLHGIKIPVAVSLFKEGIVSNVYMEHYLDGNLFDGDVMLINSLIRDWAPYATSVLIKIDTI